MAVIDVFIVNVGLPTIHARLHASGASLQLIVAGYTIAYAVLIVTTIQLAIVTGVATFGTLYLNLAGWLPVHPLAGSLRHVSAHAVSVTGAVLAAAIASRAVWAALAGRADRSTPGGSQL
jgi:hypothetical protein